MQNSNQLLDAVSQSGVLLNVSVRYWRAAKKLNAEDLGLSESNITESLISLGHKKLVPRSALKDFAIIESRAHALVDESTFSFLGGIARYLPNTKLASVTAKLAVLEHEFHNTYAQFISQYADLRAQALRDWRDAARKLSHEPAALVEAISQAFPEVSGMSRYFSFSTQLFQVRVPERVSVGLIKAGKAEAVAKAREAAVSQAQSKIMAGVDEFVRDSVSALRQETAKLCDDMLSSMSAGKTDGVHQKTLNRLTKFIDQFRDLNFAGDKELESYLSQVKRDFLSKSAESYRDDAGAQAKLRDGIRNLADQARELARKDTTEIVDNFGQLGVRKLVLAA